MCAPKIEVSDYIDAQVKLIHELRSEGVVAKGIYIKEDMNIPVDSVTREFVLSRCVAGRREAASGVPGVVQESRRPATSGEGKRRALLVTIEAIHPGLTKNLTYYADNHLEASARSWTTPYNKPVLKNHDTWVEPLGRVVHAEMTDSMLKPGTRALRIVHRITDPDTIEKVIDGRYVTTSIGGTAKALTCSICGSNLMENWCDHYRGRKYEGKTAYWIVGPIEFDEDSYVNVPADEMAQVISWAWEEEDSTPSTTGERRDTQMEGSEILNTIESLMEGKAADSAPVAAVKESASESTSDPAGVTSAPVDAAGEGQDGVQTGEGAQLKLQLSEAEGRIAELETQVAELTTKVEDLEEKLQAAEMSATALVAGTDEAKAELSTANAEVTRLLRQNVELARYAHRQMVERVIDLRIAMGETAADQRETLMVEMTTRKPAELLELAKTTLESKPARVVTQVTSPGQINHDAATGTSLESANGAEKTEYTLADLEESFVGMLKGAANLSPRDI